MGEGVALAEGLVLLGVESLPFQVDLAYLRTARVKPHGVGGGRRVPFPASHEFQRQRVEGRLVNNTGLDLGGEGARPETKAGGTHRTHEASIMPAEAQRLQETIPCVDLEVTAPALRAKHLLIV